MYTRGNKIPSHLVIFHMKYVQTLVKVSRVEYWYITKKKKKCKLSIILMAVNSLF